MGARGPIGKRSEERMGHRSKEEKDSITKAPSGPPTDLPDLPDADPLWHPIAADWYLSLRDSGQAAFYQPSDWAVARYAADLMSKVLLSERGPNGQLVAALNSVMSSLLTTEGDRRRARMELERKKPSGQADADVTVLDDYRSAFGG
ncbi:phage terminase small subunit [Streptomyces tendae]